MNRTDSIAITLAGLALLAAPLPASAQLQFTAAQLLPGDADFGPSAGVQDRADIARGGNVYLAVWTDYRSSPDDSPPFASEGSGADIYATRLSATGDPIDESPVLITQAYGDQVDPRVAWNGQHWLVVWESANLSFWDSQLRGVRIDQQGTILDDPPIAVHTAGSPTAFKLAGGAGGWAVLLQSSSAGESDLRAVHVAGDGTVPLPGGIQIDDTNFLLSFDLAFAQDEYLLTWSGVFDGAHAQRFDPTLAAIDRNPFVIPWGTRVTTDGDDFLIAWHNNGGPQGTINAARVSHEGVVLDPAGFNVATLFFVQDGVDVAWDGQRYWLAWQQTATQLQMARVTTAGTVVDPGGFTVTPDTAGAGGFEMTGAAGGGVQLVWNDGGAPSDHDVFTAPVTGAGQLAPSSMISSGAPAQLDADFADGPGTNLVVFTSRLSDSARILAQRLDAGGAALDAQPIEVAAGTAIGSPAAAWNGSLYLITWTDGQNVYGRRMFADGSFADEAPLTIMPGFSPDVAALGDTFLVAGVYYLLSNIQWQATFTMRVDGATGALLDAEPYAVGGFIIFARWPHVVRFGDRWLLTWQTNASHDDAVASVRGAFVDADGTSPGVFVVTFTGWRPDVAVSDDRALFVWSTNTVASANNDLAGRIMLADGTFPGTQFTISAATDKQLRPAVTFDGQSFIAAWQDKRNAVIYFDERTDVYAARIDLNGTVLDPAGVAIAADAVPELDVALLSTGGMTLAATSMFSDDPAYESYRVGIQSSAFPPSPGDANGDGVVNTIDLLAVLAAWGPCPGCPEDFDGDGLVGVLDFLAVLANWS